MSLARTLVVLGLVVVAMGIVVGVAERFPGLRIGRLPGDISIQRGSFRFFFPLGTSILLSIVLTLLFWIFRR
jgi:hypothetical protein